MIIKIVKNSNLHEITKRKRNTLNCFAIYIYIIRKSLMLIPFIQFFSGWKWNAVRCHDNIVLFHANGSVFRKFLFSDTPAKWAGDFVIVSSLPQFLLADPLCITMRVTYKAIKSKMTARWTLMGCLRRLSKIRSSDLESDNGFRRKMTGKRASELAIYFSFFLCRIDACNRKWQIHYILENHSQE